MQALLLSHRREREPSQDSTFEKTAKKKPSNSNPLRIKHFVSGNSISFKYEWHNIMQIQYTKIMGGGGGEGGVG